VTPLQTAFARNDFLRTALTPFDALCLTVWGEARSESDHGVQAVTQVILNRVHSHRWGTTINNVVFFKWQFSCWIPNGGMANYLALQNQTAIILRGHTSNQRNWLRVRELAEPLYSFRTRFAPIGRATHYITNELRDTAPPKWVLDPSTKLVTVVDNHTFYEAR
jgi:hypothetical protein